MALLSEQQKANIKLLWFNIIQILYGFPPVQRVLLVFGIIAIIPGYWATRWSFQAYYNWDYGRTVIEAHGSFENPRAITIVATDIFSLTNDRYLAYAEITNPNLGLAAYSVPFTLMVKNQKNEQIYATLGSSFLLPGGHQFILSTAFQSLEKPSSVVLEFGQTHWQNRFFIPNISLATPAVTYRDSDNGLQIEGSVANNSPYELASVRLTFLIYDVSGNIVGVTQRDEFSFRPNTRRTFPQVWPGTLTASDISKIVTVVSTNSLDSRNLNVEAGQINQRSATGRLE